MLLYEVLEDCHALLVVTLKLVVLSAQNTLIQLMLPAVKQDGTVKVKLAECSPTGIAGAAADGVPVSAIIS